MESSVFLIGFSTFLLGFIIGAAVLYLTQKKMTMFQQLEQILMN